MFLQHIKVYYYDLDYSSKKKAIKKFDKTDKANLDKSFDEVINKIQDNAIKTKLVTIKHEVARQSESQLGRIKVVEDLAGIGLSIEATHHDLDHLIKRSNNLIDHYIKALISDSNEYISKDNVVENFERLRGILSTMNDLLVDMKCLFASTQRKSRQLRVSEILNKVIGYYKNLLNNRKIDFEINNIGTNPLVIIMPEALLMTIFINIFDNAIYWLEDDAKENKQIKITVNSDEQYIVFADNGPGIYPEEKEKIFEAFFTGKGLEGRGLGLYICRQFMERYEYSIEVIEGTPDCLCGANFLLNFFKE